MHVAMVSDLESGGGAAVAAARLAEGLLAGGARVTRIVARPDGQSHAWETREVFVQDRLPGRFLRHFLSEEAADQSRGRLVQTQLAKVLEELQPDVINLHNIHEAGWSPEIARTCRKVAPTVWTLHDTWSFTGRCAYNYDCRKFTHGCDAACPTPAEYPALAPARIAPAWDQRREVFQDCPALVAVAPSRWLAREARAGLWSGHRVEVIPYGLDLEKLHPIDRRISQCKLGISPTGPVLLVAATDLGDRRKGGALVTAALDLLSGKDITVVTMGSGRLSIAGRKVHPMGVVTDDEVKRLVYSAADLFVHPALADNLPNVLLESLACGTPVVGLPIGGVPDVVRPGLTGWLAREATGPGLVVALEEAWRFLAEGKSLRDSCREVAEHEYALQLQASRYLELFEELKAA